MQPAAMPTPEIPERARRIRQVREMAGLKGRRLQEEMGSKDASLVSRLENGKTPADRDRLYEIALVCAGRGVLVGKVWRIFEYLCEEIDDPREIIDPEANSRAPGEEPRRYYSYGPSDLGFWLPDTTPQCEQPVAIPA